MINVKIPSRGELAGAVSGPSAEAPGIPAPGERDQN
jgi:hypothetical protein